MRFHTKLLVQDGKVLCPKIEGWRGIGDCARCRELDHMPAEGPGARYVECHPDIPHVGRTLDRMVRA